MQGRSGDGVDPPSALGYLRDALEELGAHASRYQVPQLLKRVERRAPGAGTDLQDAKRPIRGRSRAARREDLGDETVVRLSRR